MATPTRATRRSDLRSESESQQRLARAHRQVANAGNLQEIVAMIRELAEDEHRLHLPFFTLLGAGILLLALPAAAAIATLYALLLALHIHDMRYASDVDQIAWMMGLGASGGVTLLLALGTGKTLGKPFSLFRRSWQNASWYNLFRDAVTTETESRVLGRGFPEYHGVRLWHTLKERFNDFDHGDEDQHITYLAELNWPETPDESDDIAAGRARLYRFEYTEVQEHTSTDSQGFSQTDTTYRIRTRWGIYLPFLHRSWVLLKTRRTFWQSKGNYKPHMSALRSAFGVHVQDLMAASLTLKPAVEKALAEALPYFESLEVELAKDYQSLKEPPPMSEPPAPKSSNALPEPKSSK